MLRGLTTTSFYADDLTAARTWYTELLGHQPYFVRDGYLEWRVGDYEHEFGIVDARYAPHPNTTPAGAIAYWCVDDLPAAFDRLQTLGATVHDQPRVRGEGFTTASVIDPFGNILGIMANTHYHAILATTGRQVPNRA